MKKIIFALIVAFTTVVSYASVNSQTGCGLGSQLIKDDSTAIMLALQATTNGSSANQTFGVSSGTLGCDKTRIVMDERVKAYVASNSDKLSKEIAQGQGESVDTLAELMKVSDKTAFASNLQRNYASIYTSKDSKMNTVVDNIATL